jgi:hypothetical protein
MSALADAVTSLTARSNASSFALDGLVNPQIFLTNWSDASPISASVAGGSKLDSVLMFLHMAALVKKRTNLLLKSELLAIFILINQIRTTRAVFHLGAQEIIWLKKSGVSDRVVMEMQNTRPQTTERLKPTAPGTILPRTSP